MAGTQREFQIFAKPAGSACNLACSYCYYTGRETLRLKGGPPGMADDILEEYIRQHIDASAGPEVQVLLARKGAKPYIGLRFSGKCGPAS